MIKARASCLVYRSSYSGVKEGVEGEELDEEVILRLEVFGYERHSTTNSYTLVAFRNHM